MAEYAGVGLDLARRDWLTHMQKPYNRSAALGVRLPSNKQAFIYTLQDAFFMIAIGVVAWISNTRRCYTVMQLAKMY